MPVVPEQPFNYTRQSSQKADVAQAVEQRIRNA